MMSRLGPMVLAALIIAGCSGTRIEKDENALAAAEMNVADSLEAASSIREAAEHYEHVAVHFPQSASYLQAVRKSALLESNPMNGAANDSTALYWWRNYARLPIPSDERENAESHVTTLERLISAQKGIEELTESTHKQSVELSIRANRIRDLETQLKQATDELQKLRDIDVKTYKRGTKK